jgi:hypothetical protein
MPLIEAHFSMTCAPVCSELCMKHKIIRIGLDSNIIHDGIKLNLCSLTWQEIPGVISLCTYTTTKLVQQTYCTGNMVNWFMYFV